MAAQQADLDLVIKYTDTDAKRLETDLSSLKKNAIDLQKKLNSIDLDRLEKKYIEVSKASKEAFGKSLQTMISSVTRKLGSQRESLKLVILKYQNLARAAKAAAQAIRSVNRAQGLTTIASKQKTLRSFTQERQNAAEERMKAQRFVNSTKQRTWQADMGSHQARTVGEWRASSRQMDMIERRASLSKDLLKNEMSTAKIAEKYGVSMSTARGDVKAITSEKKLQQKMIHQEPKTPTLQNLPTTYGRGYQTPMHDPSRIRPTISTLDKELSAGQQVMKSRDTGLKSYEKNIDAANKKLEYLSQAEKKLRQERTKSKRINAPAQTEAIEKGLLNNIERQATAGNDLRKNTEARNRLMGISTQTAEEQNKSLKNYEKNIDTAREKLKSLSQTEKKLKQERTKSKKIDAPAQTKTIEKELLNNAQKQMTAGESLRKNLEARNQLMSKNKDISVQTADVQQKSIQKVENATKKAAATEIKSTKQIQDTVQKTAAIEQKSPKEIKTAQRKIQKLEEASAQASQRAMRPKSEEDFTRSVEKVKKFKEGIVKQENIIDKIRKSQLATSKKAATQNSQSLKDIKTKVNTEKALNLVREEPLKDKMKGPSTVSEMNKADTEKYNKSLETMQKGSKETTKQIQDDASKTVDANKKSSKSMQDYSKQYMHARGEVDAAMRKGFKNVSLLPQSSEEFKKQAKAIGELQNLSAGLRSKEGGVREKALKTYKKDAQGLFDTIERGSKKARKHMGFMNSKFAKFSIIMSGMAATMFVWQQLSASIRAIINQVTNLEKALMHIRSEGKLGTEQITSMMEASSKINLAGTFGRDEYFKKIENLQQIGLPVQVAQSVMEQISSNQEKLEKDTLTGYINKFKGAMSEFSIALFSNSNALKVFLGSLTEVTRWITKKVKKEPVSSKKQDLSMFGGSQFDFDSPEQTQKRLEKNRNIWKSRINENFRSWFNREPFEIKIKKPILMEGFDMLGAGPGNIDPKKLTSKDIIIKEIANGISKASIQFNIDPKLIRSLIKIESSFVPDAVPRDKSGDPTSSAFGLTQMIKSTRAEMNVPKNFTIEEDIMGGIGYLDKQIKEFGSVFKGLVAYKAGATTMRRWEKNQGVADPDRTYMSGKTKLSGPEFKAESEAYAKKIMADMDAVEIAITGTIPAVGQFKDAFISSANSIIVGKQRFEELEKSFPKDFKFMQELFGNLSGTGLDASAKMTRELENFVVGMEFLQPHLIAAGYQMTDEMITFAVQQRKFNIEQGELIGKMKTFGKFQTATHGTVPKILSENKVAIIKNQRIKDETLLGKDDLGMSAQIEKTNLFKNAQKDLAVKMRVLKQIYDMTGFQKETSAYWDNETEKIKFNVKTLREWAHISGLTEKQINLFEARSLDRLEIARNAGKKRRHESIFESTGQMTGWLYKNEKKQIEKDYIAQMGQTSVKDYDKMQLIYNTRESRIRKLDTKKTMSEFETQGTMFQETGIASGRYIAMRRIEIERKAKEIESKPGLGKPEGDAYRASQEKKLTSEINQSGLDSYEKMMDSTTKMSEIHYDERLRRINNEYKHIVKITGDTGRAYEWLTKRKMSLDIENLKGSESFMEGLQRGQKMLDIEHHEKTAESVSKRWVQAANEMESAWDRGFFAVLEGRFDSLADVGVSALEAIRDSMGDLLNDMLKAAMQPALSGIFNSMFGASGNVSTAQANTAAYWDFTDKGHSGGIMSSGNFKPLPKFHSGTFGLSTPKLHSGTPSLRSDEYPAILQRGEAIIPKGKIGSLGGGSNVNVIINNTTGEKTNVTETQQSPGQARQIMVTIGNDVIAGGPIAKSMEQTYGLKRIGRMG